MLRINKIYSLRKEAGMKDIEIIEAVRCPLKRRLIPLEQCTGEGQLKKGKQYPLGLVLDFPNKCRFCKYITISEEPNSITCTFSAGKERIKRKDWGLSWITTRSSCKRSAFCNYKG